MVVWKDTEMPLPVDEEHRWDQLAGYNILDTVRRPLQGVNTHLHLAYDCSATSHWAHSVGSWGATNVVNPESYDYLPRFTWLTQHAVSYAAAQYC